MFIFVSRPAALNCLAVLGVCVTCLCVIKHNLQRGVHDSRSGRAETNPSELQVSPGESLYIELLGAIFSLMACAFVLKSRPEPIASRDYLSVETEDGESEPLIGGAVLDEE